MVAHILKLAGHTVGLTTTDGVYINGQLTVKGDMTGPVSARMVLRDPSVDAAVLETARGGILRRGLGYRRHKVGAVLNISSDHLGLKGVDTLEQLAEVKRVVVEVAQDTAVLNADDEHCLRMADHTKAAHLCYVTRQTQFPLVQQHIRAGGRACVLEEGVNGNMITLFDRGLHLPVLWTHAIPCTHEGRAAHNVQNAMFAAAIAYAMGAKIDDIRQGLKSFDTSFELAPGRTNVYTRHPFQVIMDYGHNVAAVKAMCELAQRMQVRGKRICVLAAPGDRRDEDIAGIGRVAAGHFDHYLCRRDDGLRGRKPDEVPRMLRSALLEEGVPANQVELIPDEQEAVSAALRMARPGDLVLIFADQLQRTWNQISHFDAVGARSGDTPAPATVDVSTDGVELEDGQLLIRDERGVRLARETETTD
jgi:cyanophycin synthetase